VIGSDLALFRLVAFATLLRSHGFAASSDQTTDFLAAIGLLGPRGLDDIARAAHALFAPPPERHGEFDALFRAYFLGTHDVADELDVAVENEKPRAHDAMRDGFEPPTAERLNEAGQAAAEAELLALRRLRADDDAATLRRLARLAPGRLPRRRGYRMMAANRGHAIAARRALRDLVRNDGDVARLPRRKRRPRLRNILLLIDVSGSMKARTDAHLRFAHALSRAAPNVETFTFGTRLTRVTRAVRLKRRELALQAVSDIVADWDGGTRIGDALQSFLALPRFVGCARGALALVLSDGLERGDHAAMVDAVAHLSRLGWRLVWLSPLAGGVDYAVETAALKAILPLIDDLTDGGSTAALCDYVLERAARPAA
jgi:uncharacterized protein with von Willebrand factor type A (vWA) domain